MVDLRADYKSEGSPGNGDCLDQLLQPERDDRVASRRVSHLPEE